MNQIDEYNRLLMLKLFRRYLALIVLIISLGMIVWTFLPDKREVLTQTITPEMMQMEIAGSRFSLPIREVRLEWPSRMRIDEAGVISLIFQPAVVIQEKNALPVGVTYPYSNYNLMAEGRYDVAGMKVDPANPTRESLPAGQTVKFKWQISTGQAGVYDGTVWLSLRFLPIDGSEATQTPIFIKPIFVQVDSLLGLNRGTATLLGGMGVLLAGILASGDIINVRRKWKKLKSHDVRGDSL